MAIYSDLNPRLGEPGQYLEKITDKQAIREALTTLIATPVGSRLFNRQYGCRVDEYISEQLDERNLHRIKQAIDVAIRDWEPRVADVSTTVGYDSEILAYYIELSYSIPALGNIQDTFAFNVR